MLAIDQTRAWRLWHAHDAPRERRQTWGAAAAELAFVLPVFLTLALGCIDFGRFAYTYIAVTNAARAGAAFASVHPYTPTTYNIWVQNVQRAASGEVGTVSIGTVTVGVPVINVDADGLRRVAVQVSCPFATVYRWPGVPSSITLQRSVEMPMIR